MNQLDSIGREEVDVDYLSAAAWDESAHDRMRRLREDAPLYWAPQNELWIVSKYEDIVEISRDPELFCSSQGIRPGIPVRQALIDEDDPKHCQLRRTINRGFTPRMVKLLEENRRVINQHQMASSGSKISFTHLIVWAVVRALGNNPVARTLLMPRGLPAGLQRHCLEEMSYLAGLLPDLYRRESGRVFV